MRGGIRNPWKGWIVAALSNPFRVLKRLNVVAVPGVLRRAKLSNALSVQPHTNASDTREPFLTGGLLPGGHPLTQVVPTGPSLTGGLPRSLRAQCEQGWPRSRLLTHLLD